MEVEVSDTTMLIKDIKLVTKNHYHLVRIPRHFRAGTANKKIEVRSLICLLNMFDILAGIPSRCYWLRRFPCLFSFL